MLWVQVPPGPLADFFRCSSDGKSIRPKRGRPLARTQPPELATVPHVSQHTNPLIGFSTTLLKWRSRFKSGNSVAAATCTGAFCVHEGRSGIGPEAQIEEQPVVSRKVAGAIPVRAAEEQLAE